MKIIDVISGEYEIVITDEPRCNEYRRFGPTKYEHKLGYDKWDPYTYCEELEEAYKQWQRMQK